MKFVLYPLILLVSAAIRRLQKDINKLLLAADNHSGDKEYTGDMEGSADSVKVAVNIRPLIKSELLNKCTNCVTVTPGEPQVQIGKHAFTYDHVYGSSGETSCRIFDECVMPLVDALFRGYNATVLAYGQTGSGKTYTMGLNCTGETNAAGIIPKVMEEIFERVNRYRDSIEFLIRVSFIEIFKEKVFDLLDPPTQTAKSKTSVKRTGSDPNRVPLQLREADGGITLVGVSEPTVTSKKEMASFLAQGSLNRATASTHMNSQSSRSHSIFTIFIEQKRTSCSSQSIAGDDILISKLHLVDLSGSERVNRTLSNSLRGKEGIHINRGLLSLGNVISALGDERKLKEGAFVPYRDSKLTRLLKDSLGGNSKTVMIACISPADSNAEETINTLKYANRARNIQNKAVINRDLVAAEMQRPRSQREQLQGELHFARSSCASSEEIQILQEKVSQVEMENLQLYRKCNDLAQKATDAQDEIQRINSQKEDECREKDKLIYELKEQKLKEEESLVRSLEYCCEMQLTDALLEAEAQKSMWLLKEKIIQVDDSDDLGLKHKNRKRNLADENEIIQVDDSDDSGLKHKNMIRNLADEDEIIQVDDSDESGLKQKNKKRNLAEEDKIIQVDDSDDSGLKQTNKKRNLEDENESAMKSGLRV